MHTFESETFNHVYPQLVRKVLEYGVEVPSRVAPTRELHPVLLEIYDPRQRLVTAPGRPINVAFALAEVLWIIAGRRDVDMLSFYNKRIAEYSDDGQTFNAAYGYRLRHQHGVDQLNDVVRTLEEDPGTRQAVLSLWHPMSDRGWTPNGKLDTKDRACNVLSHLMIRNGFLDWLQVVRSNDLLWGSPYNWMQFTHLQEFVATRLGIPVGRYFHLADSLHIYDYHYDEAERISQFDLYDELNWRHVPMKYAGSGTMRVVMELEEGIRHQHNVNQLDHSINDMPRYWQHVLRILQAHSFYRGTQDCECFAQLTVYDNDPVYAASALRFYYAMRWGKEQIRAIENGIDKEFPKPVAAWIRGA